jgi:competence protein ComFC
VLTFHGARRVTSINLQQITGNWRSGFALDLHTTSSVYLGVDEYGHDRFDTTYSELGALLNRLKYKSDQTAAPEIISTASNFLRRERAKFDLIIPVPPSTARTVQPVILMANGIGAAVGLPVIPCVTTTRSTAQLKSISDPEKRKEALAGLHAVDIKHTNGKNVLLFDDLFRSGSTMNAITDVLLQQGRAANVYAFTITRTRSNR